MIDERVIRLLNQVALLHTALRHAVTRIKVNGQTEDAELLEYAMQALNASEDTAPEIVADLTKALHTGV
jgi:hypothetical protein